MRKKDANWNVGGDDNAALTWDGCQLAVLMDIRDEFKELNAVFRCLNFLEIPEILRTIRANTAKPKRRVVKKRGKR